MDREILTQDEINALLQDMNSESASPVLTDEQKDALGEIGNISYGTAATVLSQLLNKKVEINTPTVFITTPRQLKEQHPFPYVLLEVDYKEGLTGTNVLILKVTDASVIAGLFLGGDVVNPKDSLDDLEISAVTEAMNQMVGNAATSMSTLFNRKVDMKPPRVEIVDFSQAEKSILRELDDDDSVAAVQFRLIIEGLVDSEIVLLFPFSFAVELVDTLLGQANKTAASVTPSPAATQPNPALNGNTASQQHVKVRPAQFSAFENNKPPKDTGNIGLILDVPLQVTVELGSTRMKIKDILELGLGSVVELDKLAGDPVDIFVNGKLIAKGEVVVIDENFGVKVTDIVSHLERVNTLQ